VTSDPIARYRTRRGKLLERAERLRPMSSGEVLDAALRVYQRQGLSFLRLTAVPSLFPLAAFAFVMFYVLPAFGTTRDAASIAVQAAEAAGAIALAILIGGPVFLSGLTYATAAVVRLVADGIEGRQPDEESAETTARAIMGSLFWVNVRQLLVSLGGILLSVLMMIGGALATTVTSEDSPVAGLIALLGILAVGPAILVFILVMTREALASPVAVLEGLRGASAARRSRELLKGGKGRMSGAEAIWSVYTVLGFVFFATWGVSYLALDLAAMGERVSAVLAGQWYEPLLQAAVNLLPLYLAIWVTMPIWASTLTVVYYERRIRLEGFDIESLAEVANVHGRANRFDV
jgi:hypothetical protein